MPAPQPVYLMSPDGGASTPTTASSGNVASTAAVATIAASAGVTNWATGFICTASGATLGLPVNVTLTGLVGGTMTFAFAFPAGVLVGATPLSISFPSPIPATGVNTALTLTLPSGGVGNTNASVVLVGLTTRTSAAVG